MFYLYLLKFFDGGLSLILIHKSKNREVREASEENAKRVLCTLIFFICEICSKQTLQRQLQNSEAYGI